MHTQSAHTPTQLGFDPDDPASPSRPSARAGGRLWTCIALLFLVVLLGGNWYLDKEARDSEAEWLLLATAKASPAVHTVRTVAFAPDGTSLASGSTDGAVRVWNPRTGRERLVLRGHTANVRSVAFARDGKTLATAGGSWPHETGELIVWDATDGQLLQVLLDGNKPVTSVTFHPNGQMLAAGQGDGRITVWDTTTWQELFVLEEPDEVLALAFAPDGQTLATGCADGKVRLWHFPSRYRRAVMAGHKSSVWSVTFSPDGQTLASTGDGGKVWLWDVATGWAKHTLRLEDGCPPIRSLAFSPDNRLLVLANGSWHRPGQLRVWDVFERKEKAVLLGETDAIYAVAVAPDGRTVATGGGDQVVRLWDLSAEKPITVMQAEEEPPPSP